MLHSHISCVWSQNLYIICPIFYHSLLSRGSFQAVVDICREYFPAIASGWGDSRVNLVCEDASAYVREKNDFFDVIIADTSGIFFFFLGIKF